MGFFDDLKGVGKGLGIGAADNILGTNIFGPNSTDKAIDAQTDATTNANQALTNAYDQQRAYVMPWQEAGMGALDTLKSGNILGDYRMGPGYQFRLNEGEKSINNGFAARGMGNSGAALKALTRYGQDYASNEYDKAYNREYNRLGMLAGYGNNASNTLVNAAGAYGAGLSNNYTGLGNAQASANIAQANQQSQLLGQGISAGALLMMSDRRTKTSLKHIPRKELDEMRKNLKAFYFEYKDKLHGTGRWIGIMSQDLEKSKLGREVVVENANGEKMIDMNRVLSIFLATQAEAV